MSSDRFTLKYFHDQYAEYKQRELDHLVRRKNEKLEKLYDMYKEMYTDGHYIYDNMIEAIDMGNTSFDVFCEYEESDITLWATDLANLFMNDNVVANRCSLKSLLASQLSDEFRFTVDYEHGIDRRDNSPYQRFIARVSWSTT